MRRSPLVLVLLVSACPGETNSTSFTSIGIGTSSSSSGDVSGGSATAPTTADISGDPTTAPTSSHGVGSTAAPGSSSADTSTTDAPDPTGTTTGTSAGDASSSSTGEAAPSCDDSAQNQDETDVDCGGASCEPCELGGACLVDIDCGSAWCDAGTCAPPDCLADVDCDALDGPCAAAACDVESRSCVVTAIHEAMACDDGELCTVGEVCTVGACVGGAPVLCPGLETFCGVGMCDAATGQCAVVSKPGMDGTPCDDGFVCTPNDSCQAGHCGPGYPGFLLFEDFTALATGWEVGATWEVGAAMASESAYNGADPADDHSPGADAMLAGVVIGGLVPLGAQDKTCLSSPEIDATGQATLWLTFWRHLHTEYFPFVIHTVEAFDGVLWQPVDIGYANPGIDDADWTFHEYDIAAFAGPNLRVRICYTQTDQATLHAGWSLDDLTVGPYSCTPAP